MKDIAYIKYLRTQPINGRLVAFAQLFDDKGGKIFPDRTIDAPLTEILAVIEEDDYDVANAYDIMRSMIRDHGYAA
jgi:hypothetical protein